MSTNKKIIKYVICYSFILFTFLANIHFCCFDETFYTNEHNKLQLGGLKIAEYIGISDDELQDLTSLVLDYLNDRETSLDYKLIIDGSKRKVNNPDSEIEVFNDEEKAHMIDVKKLNLYSIKIMYISLFVFVVSLIYYFFNKDNNLYNIYKNSLIKVLIFFAILISWILIDFDSFWTLFHHIFFAGNDLWILSLRTDILIMIVPPTFFYHLVIRIVINFILSIIIFGLFLYFIERRIIVND